MRIQVQRTRWLGGLTDAEYHLGMHVRIATHARHFAKDGDRENARIFGRTARQHFEWYLGYKAREQKAAGAAA